MKTLVIVGIVLGVLLVGGIVFASAISADQPSTEANCLSCKGSCTAEQNCGQQTCGALQGKTCSCGR